ncbi:hypothetical protein ACQP1W_30700 [Spirillospora sp. CA-255316]
MRISDVQGDLTGTFIHGDGNSVHTVQASEPDDREELVAFVRAVVQALPVLAMEPEQRENARVLAVQILRDAEDPAAERGRMASLGRSLRTILEQTGSSALTTSLLSLWMP